MATLCGESTNAFDFGSVRPRLGGSGYPLMNTFHIHNMLWFAPECPSEYIKLRENPIKL